MRKGTSGEMAGAKRPISEIPKGIVEQFLAEFSDAGAPTELIKRLDKCLLEDANFTFIGVNNALFPKE